MPSRFLASEAAVMEEQPRVPGISAARKAVIAATGVTKMGPIATRVACRSWEDFLKTFGGHDANAPMVNHLRMAWKQDPGADIRVSRTVHFTDPTNAATKISAAATIDINSNPTAATAGAVTGSIAGHTFDDAGTLTRAWRLANGDTIIVHVDEDGLGPDTATITATPASITGGATGLPVGMGETVTFTCDKVPGSQVVTFGAAHATIAAVAQDINDQVAGFKAIVVGGATVDFTSDTIGSDSAISITAADAPAKFGHAAPSVGAGAGGNVGDVFHVTWQELKAIIEAAVVNPVTGCTVSLSSGNFLVITSNTTGALSRVMVEVASTADDELGLDNALHTGSAAASVPTLTIDGKYDGTYAHDLRIIIEAASNGNAAYFNLRVTDSGGVTLETFPNLQIATPADADYVETVINADPDFGGSRYIAATDLLVTIRPVNGSSTPAAGDDGLVGLVDNDFIGDPAGGTGLHAFDSDNEISIFIDAGRATATWQAGLINYLDSFRTYEAFGFLDPPAGRTAATMVTYASGAGIIGLSEFAAIYWPRIKILNPDDTVYTSDSDGNITIGVSGALAGMVSRNSAAELAGIWKQPAGIQRGKIYGALGLETDQAKDLRAREIVFPQRINPVTTDENGVVFVDGEYGLKAAGIFPYVGGRIGMTWVNKSVRNGLNLIRHEDIDNNLMSAVSRQVGKFIKGQKDIEGIEDYWVQCDEALNPPAVQALARLYVRVAVRTKNPAIWVIILVSRDTRADEEVSS